MKSVGLLFVLVFLTALCCIAPLPVGAASKTIVVPDDYATIEDAIANAVQGDTVFVKRGTYEGPINKTLIISRTISLIGQDAETTTLHLHPEWVTQIIITTPLSYYAPPLKIEANGVRISGLTITSDGGEIRADANNTQIQKNVFHVDVSLSGSYQSFTENTLIGASVTCRGTYANVSHNTVLNGLIGSDSGSNDRIFANNVTGCIGIGGTSSYESVYGNTVRDNGQYWAGISVASFGAVIANNTVTNCSRGISVDWGSANIVCGNIIANNYGPALAVSGGISDFFANHVANNFIGVQTGTAIFAIHHNNFLNNNVQVETTDVSFWSMDNGKEGNYWSDYAGKDANGDGIGDARYLVKNEVADNFPLMSPFDISSVTVPLAEADNVFQKVLELLEYTPTHLTPLPSPSAEPSSSQTPTIDELGKEALQAEYAAASVIVAVIVGAGLVVYFKKRKS